MESTLAQQVMARHRRRTRGADDESAPSDRPGARLLVPTGSTLLNLALSDSPWGGLLPGKVVSVPGASSSGKTVLVFTMFAEMCADPRFADWDLVYDDAEAANEFNIGRLFGPEVARRMRAPATDADGAPLSSETMEDFLINVVRLARGGRPFVYVLDSLDALVSKEELEIVDAKVAGTRPKGSMGAQKAKQMGELLRHCVRALKASQGLLVIISQLRDNMSSPIPGAKTYSGGRALLYYSSAQVWLDVAERIKTADKRHIIGVRCRWRVRKDKATGKERDGEFPIYYALGIDDIGSCVDWLVDEEFWPQRGNTIETTGLSGVASGTRDKVVRQIETHNLEHGLRELVGKRWAEVEEKLSMRDRKRRYT